MLKVKKQLHRVNLEEHARLLEENAAMVEQDRFPGQDDFENHERQEGHRIHSSEMIRRITVMNPKLWVEGSVNMKGHANFYYLGPLGDKRCAGAPFKLGWIREYSIVYTDRSGRVAPVGPGNVPVEYGWRTVLARLLAKELVTWPQILLHFEVNPAAQSDQFDQQTQPYKN